MFICKTKLIVLWNTETNFTGCGSLCHRWTVQTSTGTKPEPLDELHHLNCLAIAAAYLPFQCLFRQPTYHGKGSPIFQMSIGFRSWSQSSVVSLQVIEAINPPVGCHYFSSVPGYLPSRWASPPLGWYQIVLLGDRGICVWTTCPGLHSAAGIRTHDLLIASPAPQPLGHQATTYQEPVQIRLGSPRLEQSFTGYTNISFCQTKSTASKHHNYNKPTNTSASSKAPADSACQMAGSWLESRASTEAPLWHSDSTTVFSLLLTAAWRQSVPSGWLFTNITSQKPTSHHTANMNQLGGVAAESWRGLRLIGHGLESQPPRCRVQPWVS